MLLGVALPCLMAIKNVGRVIKLAHAQFHITLSCFNSYGALRRCPQRSRNAVEFFGSFDHHELSKAEQRFANVGRCSVKCCIHLNGPKFSTRKFS